MNDPHVVSLTYRVTHAESVSYAKAVPLDYKDGNLAIRVEENRAKVTFSDHFASVEEARNFVEPFLQDWEFYAGLTYGPDQFRFQFDSAEVIDRSPEKGRVVHADTGVILSIGSNATLTVGRAKYPDAPAEITRDPDVDLMYARYCRYRRRATTLSDTAYFCLTVIEKAAGGRKEAATHYSIQLLVLRKIGELTATKGGAEARKAAAVAAAFSDAETAWLEEAVKKIILRAAQVAHGPTSNLPEITMDQLPKITS